MSSEPAPREHRDPSSPSGRGPAGRPAEPVRTAGVDGSGRPVRLGDVDCHGVRVGYIDEGGLGWESRLERDVAVVSGRCWDAARALRRSGGALGSPPDVDAIIRDCGVLAEHEDACRREGLDAASPHSLMACLSAAHSADAAAWN